MPTSTDNQDYGKKDEQNKQSEGKADADKSKLDSDDLKGKKVDADPKEESGKPANT